MRPLSTEEEMRPSKIRRLLCSSTDVDPMPTQCFTPTRSDFVYQPMTDPQKQIRLLRFRPGIKQHESMDISTWTLASAPAYTAISYTWGPAEMRPLYVDDRMLNVRTNCYNALRQTALHIRTDYLWIDSICIDQTDRLSPEKSAQVGIMYKIYRRAQQVFACIGEQDYHSERLLTIINAIRPLLRAASSVGTPWRTERIWRSFFAALGQSEFRKTFGHLRGVQERPYWSRLWILQEICAGQIGAKRSELLFLCGDVSLSIRLFRRFFVAVNDGLYGLQEVMATTDLLYLERALMSSYMPQKPDFARLFKDLGGTHHCSEPHDHLYGLISMAKPQEQSMIVVDYSKSTIDLALEMITLLEKYPNGFPASHTRVLATLGLNAFSSEFESLMKQCHSPGDDDAAASTRKLNFSLGMHQLCARLSVDADGIWRAPFWLRSSDPTDGWQVDYEDGIVQALLRDPDFRRPIKVMSETSVAAVVSPTARSGDIIVLVGGISDDWLLVLRPSSLTSKMYDVVGQGFCVDNFIPGKQGLPEACQCSAAERSTHETFEATFGLRLTPEESLALAGQDFVRLSPEESQTDVDWGPDDTSWDSDKRFDRLHSLPITLPAEAADVDIKRCFSNLPMRVDAMLFVEGHSMIGMLIDDSGLGATTITGRGDRGINAADDGGSSPDSKNTERVGYIEDSDLYSDSTSDSSDEFWRSGEFLKASLSERYRLWQVRKYLL